MSVVPKTRARPSHMFTTRDPDATRVCLVGSFNRWDPGATLMQKSEFGVWSVTMQLEPGRHEYKFVVDGKWRCESACEGAHGDCPHCVPNEFGSRNCVVNLYQ